ncbi:hypothetical protein HYC85_026383 [Camellia sinensis]|uniref:Uncharacterized protein n=1 Tax=Camellia sinensis TaxID=4442 RepID=A0A7J7G7G2_CAMSI|nr:hypothetical protein HYC85_026383 [Camellia sinensis]
MGISDWWMGNWIFYSILSSCGIDDDCNFFSGLTFDFCFSLLISDVDRLTFSVSPRDCGVGEGGWAGLCFSSSQWSMVAIAHSFCRSIDVYDQDIHLQTLLTILIAIDVAVLQIMLSIWDLRMKENGGCVHRIYGSVGDIFYAVCSSSTSIAVGGADRTITVYDPRRLVTMSGIISSINGHFYIPTKL